MTHQTAYSYFTGKEELKQAKPKIVKEKSEPANVKTKKEKLKTEKNKKHKSKKDNSSADTNDDQTPLVV